jgi:hypothetical protein
MNLHYLWHRCPFANPLCSNDRPCTECWKAGVLKAQEGLKVPRLTMPRIKVKASKPVMLRKKA